MLSYTRIINRMQIFRPLLKKDTLFLWNRNSFQYCATLTEVINDAQNALAVDRTAFLSQALQCEEDEAREIVNKNIYLLVKDKESVEKKARFLRTYFTVQDITEHCELLTLPLGPVTQNYFTMTELGLQNVTCSTLLNFRTIVQKPPVELIEQGYLSASCDPLQHVLTVIDRPEFSKLATEEFPHERYMHGPVINLKRNLLPRYLAHTLSTSLERARLFIRLHYELSGRCFGDVNECFSILQDVFKFSIEKIKANPYLLHQEPSNLYKIAALPSLMCGDTIEMAQKFPKVISRPVENILKVEALLREQNVSEEDIRDSRYLFTLNPITVRDLIIKRKLKKMLCR